MQFVEKEQENVDEDLDYRALEDGFVSCNFFIYHIFQSLSTLLSLITNFGVVFLALQVAITPLSLNPNNWFETQSSVSNWLAVVLANEQ